MNGRCSSSTRVQWWCSPRRASTFTCRFRSSAPAMRGFFLLARLCWRLGTRLADDALPAVRAVGHVGVVRLLRRAVDLARRLRGRCAVELLDVHRRHHFAGDIVRTVVVRRGRIVIAVGPGPEKKRRADEKDRASMVVKTVRCKTGAWAAYRETAARRAAAGKAAAGARAR